MQINTAGMAALEAELVAAIDEVLAPTVIVLRNDAQIRILAEPWLAQFDHVLEGQPQVLH